MKPRPGRDIELLIRMVHSVQPPKDGHGMETEGRCQVECCDGQEHACPGGGIEGVEQAPPLRLGNQGESDSRRRW